MKLFGKKMICTLGIRMTDGRKHCRAKAPLNDTLYSIRKGMQKKGIMLIHDSFFAIGATGFEPATS